MTETQKLIKQVFNDYEYDDEHFIITPHIENLEKILLQKVAEMQANPVGAVVIPKIAETLREKIEEAFNDMTTIYAPELTGYGAEKLAEKIQKHGKGTLGYISNRRNEITVCWAEFWREIQKEMSRWHGTE